MQINAISTKLPYGIDSAVEHLGQAHDTLQQLMHGTAPFGAKGSLIHDLSRASMDASLGARTLRDNKAPQKLVDDVSMMGSMLWAAVVTATAPFTLSSRSLREGLDFSVLEALATAREGAAWLTAHA